MQGDPDIPEVLLDQRPGRYRTLLELAPEGRPVHATHQAQMAGQGQRSLEPDPEGCIVPGIEGRCAVCRQHPHDVFRLSPASGCSGHEPARLCHSEPMGLLGCIQLGSLPVNADEIAFPQGHLFVIADFERFDRFFHRFRNRHFRNRFFLRYFGSNYFFERDDILRNNLVISLF